MDFQRSGQGEEYRQAQFGAAGFDMTHVSWRNSHFFGQPFLGKSLGLAVFANSLPYVVVIHKFVAHIISALQFNSYLYYIGI